MRRVNPFVCWVDRVFGLKRSTANATRRGFRPQVEALEVRLVMWGGGTNFDSNPANFIVYPEVPVNSRLALYDRYAPSTPSVSDWTELSSLPDPHAVFDSYLTQGHTNFYVVAHGWSPTATKIVETNSATDGSDPFKWWQLDKYGTVAPPSNEMFQGAFGFEYPFFPKTSPHIDISPYGLAYAITQADPKAVVLAYSWVDDSSSTLLDPNLSQAFTALNGTRLANALGANPLESVLPPDFYTAGGMLHLIGNSHGSKVATVATAVLGQANLPVKHLTLLDSPEDNPSNPIYRHVVRTGDAANNLWYFLGAIDPNTTFVDNYISALGNGVGPLQGVNPLNTSQKNNFLQKVVDVALDGRRLFDPISLGTTFGDLHAYAYNWYVGASVAWAGNPTPTGANQWSPLINPTIPSTLAGSYTGPQNKLFDLWTRDQQFDLKPVPGTENRGNTATVQSIFKNLVLSAPTPHPPNSIDYRPLDQGRPLTLSGNGTSPVTFTGNFIADTNLAGISFNYQFTNVGMGDQLVMSVNTGPFLGRQQIHYVMTGTVAGTREGFGTLTLPSLAGKNGTIKIQLFPASGSSGASVTITDMQQFTQPGAPSAQLIGDDLFITGTNGHDVIRVLPALTNGVQSLVNGSTTGSLSTASAVQVLINGRNMGTFSGMARIFIYGLQGNDFIVANSVSHSLTIDGGDGHDFIVGGRGRDVLIGGQGNDWLIGGTTDVMLGGGGRNRVITQLVWAGWWASWRQNVSSVSPKR